MSALAQGWAPVSLELRKQRRGRGITQVGIVMVVWTVWTTALVSVRTGAGGPMASLDFALLEIMAMSQLFVPVLVGVAASRLVAVDHEERMGQVFAALGQPAWRRFAAKLAVLVVVSVVCVLTLFTVLAGFGLARGVPTGPGFAGHLARCVAVAALACVPVAAVQLTCSARFPDRPVGLVAAIVGAFVANSLEPLRIGELGWLLPWGTGVAASPLLPASAYEDPPTHLLTTPSSAADLVALTLVGAAWAGAALWLSNRPDKD